MVVEEGGGGVGAVRDGFDIGRRSRPKPSLRVVGTYRAQTVTTS